MRLVTLRRAGAPQGEPATAGARRRRPPGTGRDAAPQRVVLDAPVVVPHESSEVGDPQDLDVEPAVNGRVTVRSTTARMIFPVAELVAYVSEVMTLEPGDVIATGTPQKLPDALAERRRLAPGDRVDITISRVGTLSTPFVADAG